MFDLGLADIILADREREIQEAIRRRRLLEPADEALETRAASRRRSVDGGTLTVRPRATGG